MRGHESEKLGPWMSTALVVGSMIGAGIFMLPVTLAPLGWNAVAGWMISGAGALCLAFALAQLTRHDGLGIQTSIERSFGATISFLATWAFWFSTWTGVAAVSIAAAAAFSTIAPAMIGATSIAPLAIGIITVLTLVNVAGPRSAGRLQVVTVVIKLLPLVAVVLLWGWKGATGERLETPAPVEFTFDNIATAIALTLFALTGFENATAPVDKIRNPSRNILIAIVGGTAFVALLYLISSTAMSFLVPWQELGGSTSPFATALTREWGSTAGMLTALCVAVSAFGCANGGVLAVGELGYSMALRGQVPQQMARTRGANIPYVSQLVAGALAVIVVALNSSRDLAGLFTFILLLGTVGVLIVYLVGSLAALKERKSPLAAIGGILFSILALYGAGAEANAWGLALLALGLLVRAGMFAARRMRSPARV